MARQATKATAVERTKSSQFIRVFSGDKFFFDDMARNTFDISSAATHLARVPRFSGATKYPYSVAQHSISVAQEMLRQTNRNYVAGMIGLLHDYHEYALGDINTPLKRFMMELGFDFNAKVADPIDRWVFGLHGITVEAYPLLHKLMHEVDSKIGTMEGLALVKGYQAPEGFSADFPFTPSHQSPEYVERQFVALYHSLNANLPRAR